MTNTVDALMFIVTFIIGLLLGIYLANGVLTPIIIEKGCGEYNTTTSNFQWINRKEINRKGIK